MCCYSGCSDCEYRLPDGGYIMADQSAARPKWIPSYDERSFDNQTNKQHTSKWAMDLYDFPSSPSNEHNGGAEQQQPPRRLTNVNQEQFVTRLTESTFAPPLGGPFLSASAGASIDDDTVAAANKLFIILSGDRDKLTRLTMGRKLKELADGEEGLMWANFEKALCE